MCRLSPSGASLYISFGRQPDVLLPLLPWWRWCSWSLKSLMNLISLPTTSARKPLIEASFSGIFCSLPVWADPGLHTSFQKKRKKSVLLSRWEWPCACWFDSRAPMQLPALCLVNNCFLVSLPGPVYVLPKIITTSETGLCWASRRKA